MKFFKKHRFKIVITILIILFVIVSFYMLWIHVPYAQNSNRKSNIEQQIVEENNYDKALYFNEHVSDSKYYVLQVEEEGKTKYVAYNDKRKLVDTYEGEVANRDTVIQDFSDAYKVSPDSVEIGYENDAFVYYLSYVEDNGLIYAYYTLDTGEYNGLFSYGIPIE